MAYLAQNGNYLSINYVDTPQCEAGTGANRSYSFYATALQNRATVGFYPLVGGNRVSSSNTTILCPGKRYAIRVIPMSGNQNIPLFLAYPPIPTSTVSTSSAQAAAAAAASDNMMSGFTCFPNNGTFTTANGTTLSTSNGAILVDSNGNPIVSGATDLGINCFKLLPPDNFSSLVLLQPQDKVIYMNQPFNARLHIGNVIQTNMFTIEGTNDVQSAVKLGYTGEFPELLTNCNVCGCPSGSSCRAVDGLCESNVPTCNNNSRCGDINGQCSGWCPSGQKCVSQNGKFRCVNANPPKQWWVWLVAGLGIFIFLIIIIIIVAVIFWSRPSEEEDVAMPYGAYPEQVYI